MRSSHLTFTLHIAFCGLLAFALAIFSQVDTAFAQGQAAPVWESAYNAESFGAEGGGQGPIREVVCEIAALMQGSLGGLLASAAVLMAVGSAAFGSFDNAKVALVVGIGSATILAGVSLYFGDLGCEAAVQNQQQTQGNQNNNPGNNFFDGED